ncbi:MerR family transcriptional regulator [Synechocystis salina]|uniref:MerR family transcriptional regulator n=1 Tax=Synechocystis salina LEGE 00031 TaxID=1828736 RepID=A0ABR9VTR5_9SYNC|nr:MerR family transcriptional regulator [Synechocystis salina]MBE9241441.1 MerR family transcriptional regulator [Synechocystis salina LEGE 00041]MBE9254750.1 MerR family transcriptional regulator [Synechocystis salina LEGE 00031]
MFFTSHQAAEITGCTLRQLQYWREKRVVSPTVDATGRGRTVYYNQVDLCELMVMKHLLGTGLEYTQAVEVLNLLREKEPGFADMAVESRYIVTRNPEDKALILECFDLDAVQMAMYAGQLVVPLWLDQIHLKLSRKLRDMSGTEMPDINHPPQRAEDEARKHIDQHLSSVGWEIVSMKLGIRMDRRSAHAVREYPLATGRADYALFVNDLLLGIVEAKHLSSSSFNPHSALEQAKRYSKGAFDGVGNWRGYRVPFLYSSNGELIYFLDMREDTNIACQLQLFHTPQALFELLGQDTADS